MWTVQAYQALRNDAVERGREAVWIDFHVSEATQHVEHVVGVHVVNTGGR